MHFDVHRRFSGQRQRLVLALLRFFVEEENNVCRTKDTSRREGGREVATRGSVSVELIVLGGGYSNLCDTISPRQAQGKPVDQRTLFSHIDV